MIKLSHYAFERYHHFKLFTERLSPIFGKYGWQEFDRKNWARLEFKWGNKSKLCLASLDLNPNGDAGPNIGLSLCIPLLFTLFIHFNVNIVKRLEDALELGLHVNFEDGSLDFRTFSTVNSWTRSGPWWRKGFTFNYKDFFLGKAVYKRQIVRTFETPATVPRGSFVSHDCIFWTNLCVDTWKRRFWPAYKLVRYDTTFVPPVPFDGKYGLDHHHSECGPLLWASVPRTLNDKNYQAMMMGHVKQKILKDMKRDR
jgi:hypothetical protein